MTALVRLEMLISHVAGIASWVIALERSFACVTSNMLSQLRCFDVALGAFIVRTVVAATVGSTAGTSF